MARPTDWHHVDLHSDPAPGDPWRVRELARQLRSLGDDAERAARDVRGLMGDDAALTWIGAAGKAFREAIGAFPGQLDKVTASHHSCADALVAFAAGLDSAQSQADRALTQARPLFDQVSGLRDQLHAANAAYSGAKQTYDASTATDLTAQTDVRDQYVSARSTVDRLNQQLSGPEAQLEALKKLAHQAAELRDGAEHAAVRQINAATDQGIPPDSFWHKLGEVAAVVWDGLVIIAKIVSFIGAIVLMFVGGPLWLIIAVVVAGLIILADTLHKYSEGKASLLDVGLAALACIPITQGFTSLGALRNAYEAGGLLSAGLHLGGAGLGAAKDLLTGLAGLLRGGFGTVARLFGDGSKAPGIFGDARDAIQLPIKGFDDGRPGFILAQPGERVAIRSQLTAHDPYFPFDVAMHGNQWQTALKLGPGERLRFDPQHLATLIRQNGWNGEPIRLMSCSTGKLGDGFAHALANDLGVPVKAPSDTLWVNSEGRMAVAPKVDGRPDYANPGKWLTFGFTPKVVDPIAPIDLGVLAGPAVLTGTLSN